MSCTLAVDHVHSHLLIYVDGIMRQDFNQGVETCMHVCSVITAQFIGSRSLSTDSLVMESSFCLVNRIPPICAKSWILYFHSSSIGQRLQTTERFKTWKVDHGVRVARADGRATTKAITSNLSDKTNFNDERRDVPTDLEINESPTVNRFCTSLSTACHVQLPIRLLGRSIELRGCNHEGLIRPDSANVTMSHDRG
jgi:hypothetical protein